MANSNYNNSGNTKNSNNRNGNNSNRNNSSNSRKYYRNGPKNNGKKEGGYKNKHYGKKSSHTSKYNAKESLERIARARKEETVEDIQSDIERVEKDIKLEIMQIKGIKL